MNGIAALALAAISCTTMRLLVSCSGAVPAARPSPGESSAGADLVATAPAVSDGSPSAGAAFTLSVTVRNVGGRPSPATTVRYYRSADATITNSDTAVETTEVAELAASWSDGQSVVLTAPAAPGTYYFGACVDAVTGESDTTNNCSASAQVTVTEPKPDLVVTSRTNLDILITGDAITLFGTVENVGKAAATATTLRYYRSTDATITTSDTAVGTDAVAGLAASETSGEGIALNAPATAGTYYYGACVDAVTDESDTTNNCSASVRVEVSDDDHGNTQETATSITQGSPFSGRLESWTDVDYFKVTVTSDGTFSVATDLSRMTGLVPGYSRSADVRIETSSYTSTNTDNFDSATIDLGDDDSAEVYVRVRGNLGSYDVAVWFFDANEQDTSFDIDLRYSGTAPTTAQERAIRAAADKLESVITSDFDRVYIHAPTTCNDEYSTVFGDSIDDVQVHVRLASIDGPGGAVAYAGLYNVWSDGLPYFGGITIDTADLPSLGTTGLRHVALHEIAHVLGFGQHRQWWTLMRGLPLPGEAAGGNPYFVGSAAVSAFDELLDGSTYDGDKVPVENDAERYGKGVLYVHWRESVFDSEVMTPTISTSTSQPLSKVTLAALADIGYSVDYSEAESYTLPSRSQLQAKAAHDAEEDIHLGDDILRVPIIVVEPSDQHVPVITP